MRGEGEEGTRGVESCLFQPPLPLFAGKQYTALLLMSVGLVLFNLADVSVKPNMVRLLSCNDSRASVLCAVHASTVGGCSRVVLNF